MPTGEFQVIIPYRTGLPEDISVNTWYFSSADAIGLWGPDTVNAIAAFYGAVGDTYWHPILDFTAFRVKTYDAGLAPPRVPLGDTTLDAGITTSTNDPNAEEVAACLSFRAALTSGTAVARRKGRIFLGPLSNDVYTGDAAERTRLNSGFMAAVEGAYNTLRGELPSGVAHAQHSQTLNAFNPVVAAWMDNALDTQRRRGPDPTLKYDFTLV